MTIWQIDTGAKFPDGIALTKGRCERCDRAPGALATMKAVYRMITMQYLVCAECLADFVAGADIMGAKVYVRRADAEGTPTNVFQQVAATVPAGPPEVDEAADALLVARACRAAGLDYTIPFTEAERRRLTELAASFEADE